MTSPKRRAWTTLLGALLLSGCPAAEPEPALRPETKQEPEFQLLDAATWSRVRGHLEAFTLLNTDPQSYWWNEWKEERVVGWVTDPALVARFAALLDPSSAWPPGTYTSNAALWPMAIRLDDGRRFCFRVCLLPSRCYVEFLEGGSLGASDALMQVVAQGYGKQTLTTRGVWTRDTYADFQVGGAR